MDVMTTVVCNTHSGFGSFFLHSVVYKWDYYTKFTELNRFNVKHLCQFCEEAFIYNIMRRKKQLNATVCVMSS